MENLPRDQSVTSLSKITTQGCQSLQKGTFYREYLPAVRILLLACLLTSTSVSARPHVVFDSSKELDRQVAATLQYLSVGNLAPARLFARQLAWRFPKFALGQLLSAELESMAAFRDVTISRDGILDKRLVDLLLEAQARLNASTVASTGYVPAELIQLGSNVSEVLLVDLSNSTLFQFDANHSSPTLVSQHYIGSGKAGFGKRVEGDNKTPLGVYRITGVRSDASLPDLYGSGALMLDYPNALDLYHGRTGSGIWLHGVPHGQRSRAPRSSEGCVTMSNDHFTRLQERVSISDSRIVLSDQVNWISQTKLQQEQVQFRTLFSRYQHAWTNANQEALISLYENSDSVPKHLDLKTSDFVKVSGPSPTHSAAANPRANYLKSLAALNPDEISIFRNPSLPTPQLDLSHKLEANYVAMSAQFGSKNEHQLTIYWAKGKDGQWRVLTEQLDGKSI